MPTVNNTSDTLPSPSPAHAHLIDALRVENDRLAVRATTLVTDNSRLAAVVDKFHDHITLLNQTVEGQLSTIAQLTEAVGDASVRHRNQRQHTAVTEQRLVYERWHSDNLSSQLTDEMDRNFDTFCRTHSYPPPTDFRVPGNHQTDYAASAKKDRRDLLEEECINSIIADNGDAELVAAEKYFAEETLLDSALSPVSDLSLVSDSEQSMNPIQPTTCNDEDDVSWTSAHSKWTKPRTIRPVTPMILWKKMNREAIHAAYAHDTSGTKRSKIVSRLWKSLPAATRARYTELSKSQYNGCDKEDLTKYCWNDMKTGARLPRYNNH